MPEPLLIAVRFDGSTLLARQVREELEAHSEVTAPALADLLGAPVAQIQKALERLELTGQARRDQENRWSVA